MGRQLITGPYVNICGFRTLLKGTSAVLWHLPLLAEHHPLLSAPGLERRTLHPPLLSPVPPPQKCVCAGCDHTLLRLAVVVSHVE